VSNYYHYKHIDLHGWKGTFDDFFKIFINEKTYTGSYFDNNLDWWDLRNESNVLVIFYEDLVLNIYSTIEKIANFLKEQLEKIVHNSSFSKMFNNSISMSNSIKKQYL